MERSDDNTLIDVNEIACPFVRTAILDTIIANREGLSQERMKSSHQSKGPFLKISPMEPGGHMQKEASCERITAFLTP